MTTRSDPCALRWPRWLLAALCVARLRLLRAAATTAARHPTTRRALAGSPPPLAALHEQANELLAGGTDAYEKRIAALRGYPVVANVWASWCGPCRFEFPVLQKLSARYGKQVAFLGVNSEDADDAAETFLGEDAGPLPQLHRPRQGRSPTRSAASAASPTPPSTTAPASSSILKQGPYADDSELEADVRRYALQERIIGAMEAFVVIALVGFGLLLAELLLPTGGVLAALGVAGLIAAGIVALGSDSDAADVVGPALITLGVLSGDHLLLRHPQSHRGPPRPAGAHRHRGDGRRQRPRRARRSTPRARSGCRGRSGARGWPSGASPVRLGDRVTVEAVDGLTLVVRPEPQTAVQASEGAG